MDEADICAVEAVGLVRTCDSVNEEAQGDAHSIKNCGLAATILCYEYYELWMQFDRTIGETSEVMQRQMINAQLSGKRHCSSLRSRSDLISKLTDDTPQPGSATKELRR